jgi:hypothetical protein
MTEVRAWVTMDDGVRLAVTLYHPDTDTDSPQPVVLEALPYRKDDATLAYRAEYRRLAELGRYHVARVDVRGTGSSEGVAVDEYTEREQRDLEQVIDWLACQPWSSGAIGMYGTSYSGFNSLQVAARRPAALRAVVAIYATDDRFTDDVHYMGGALKGLDLVDYCHYMTAFNALPPVPAVFGDGWKEAWRERVERTTPWLLRWLEEQIDSPYWRNGSLRAAASGPGRDHGYERVECATMLVAGWADGYRDNSLRTFERLRCPKALLLGPWSHMSTAHSLPGPHLDLVPEMLRWWDRWLRGARNGIDEAPPIRVFVKHPTKPEPDLAEHAGAWRYEPAWPPVRLRARELRPLTTGTAGIAPRGGVGSAAWISCAGALPWGQPIDQRTDDAYSLCIDWPVGEPFEVLGHAVLHARVRATVPVAYLAAKLNSVFPDGTSALVARGLLNLTHRDSMTDPRPLTADRWYDVTVELEAGSWSFEPGHTIRLALSGSDWPNVWMPPTASPLELDLDATRLVLPVVDGPDPIQDQPRFEDAHGVGRTGSPPEDDTDGNGAATVWRIEHDVLAREVSAVVAHGSNGPVDFDGRYEDRYDGRVTTSIVDPARGSARATAAVSIAWPEATVTSTARLAFESDATCYRVEIELDTTCDGEPFVHRRWERTITRHLQ